jgi:methylated-DNA-protein-cysteine methyltransferase related protein
LGNSAFFARIKADVLKIVATIPFGKVTSFADIGAHLDVMPRHVAYILSTLEHDKKIILPWHRVVGQAGKIGAPKYSPDGTSQLELLMSEGWEVAAGKLVGFDQDVIATIDLQSEVPKQNRPLGAPTR